MRDPCRVCAWGAGEKEKGPVVGRQHRQPTWEPGGVRRNRLEGAAGRGEGEDEEGRRDNKGSHVSAKRKEGQVGPAEARPGGPLGVGPGGHR